MILRSTSIVMVIESTGRVTSTNKWVIVCVEDLFRYAEIEFQQAVHFYADNMHEPKFEFKNEFYDVSPAGIVGYFTRPESTNRTNHIPFNIFSFIETDTKLYPPTKIDLIILYSRSDA